MGIVIELQQEALSKDIDILNLLRKAYLVARKLKLEDFESWINCEMNGYGSKVKIPQYRVYHGSIVAINPLRGSIPVVFQQSSELSVHKARDPIANLKSVYEISRDGMACISFNDAINTQLSYYGNAPIVMKFQLQIPISQIYNTFECVRNTILDWSITLEENGIIGEGLQFTQSEIEKAKKTPVINNTNYFLGSVDNTQIQQGNVDSYQEQK